MTPQPGVDEGDRRLPDEPGVFGVDCGGYIQSWRKGAFGEMVTSLAGVSWYVVEKDEWDGTGEGPARRTIIQARVIDDVPFDVPFAPA